jgi:hypothetical protein
MCPEYFLNKPKRFGVFQNFLNKIGTFPFNLKTLKQNQNILLCSRIFKNKSGTFPFNTKPKRFDGFQGFLKQFFPLACNREFTGTVSRL